MYLESSVCVSWVGSVSGLIPKVSSSVSRGVSDVLCSIYVGRVSSFKSEQKSEKESTR